MDKNMLCTDVGANVLNDKDSCKAAIELIKQYRPDTYFKDSDDDYKYPTGCYLYTSSGGNKVYFSTNAKGRKSNYARPICRISNGSHKHDYIFTISLIKFL